MSPDFTKNNSDMLEAAARCIKLRQHLPAMVLIYSHIDTLAWAGSSKQKGSVRTTFEDWVNRWLLPELAPAVPTLTATDLYAARCGVLHRLTGSSDLSVAGKAKRIAYAWGTAQAQLLDEVLSSTEFAGTFVTLHYEVLLHAVEKALENFIASAQSDDTLRARLEEASGEHYTSIRTEGGDEG